LRPKGRLKPPQKNRRRCKRETLVGLRPPGVPRLQHQVAYFCAAVDTQSTQKQIKTQRVIRNALFDQEDYFRGTLLKSVLISAVSVQNNPGICR